METRAVSYSMIPEPYNFIVARFGDNDFGHTIRDALIEGVEHFGLHENACPILWKRFIVAYLIGHQLKKDAIYYPSKWLSEERNEFLNTLKNDYFDTLRVTFEKNKPTDDADHGDAAYDLNLKYAWTF